MYSSSCFSNFTVEGGTGDFFLNERAVSQFFLNPNPALAAFTFVVDGIAEDDETFALELEDLTDRDLLMGRGVFFRQIVQCTIIDADGEIAQQ